MTGQSGRLSWRYHPTGTSWDEGLRAELVTANGETVGLIRRVKERRFDWVLLKPECWVITGDVMARAARELFGPGGIADWGHGFSGQRHAAKAMSYQLDRRSIGLFGLDDLKIQPFKPPSSKKGKPCLRRNSQPAHTAAGILPGS